MSTFSGLRKVHGFWKSLCNRLICWWRSHKWMFTEEYMECQRCHKVVFRGDVNMRKNTIVPIAVVQVAEAACREAGYNKTARLLRRSLYTEK